jgi:hypothetical protein
VKTGSATDFFSFKLPNFIFLLALVPVVLAYHRSYGESINRLEC